MPPPSTATRAENYLGAVIVSLEGRLTGTFQPTDTSLRVASQSRHRDDAFALAQYLLEMGALGFDRNGGQWHLTAKGHVLYEQMTGTRRRSSQAFVAMWFNPELQAAYERGLAVAITNSGYTPIRIDMTEHIEKIDDRIIAEIRRSAFLVADFSGHRGGVYYEAGFAHGLGLRIIFTCREKDLPDLHFDIRQYNTIVWTIPEDMVAPLQNRILAVFGAGPARPEARTV